MEFFEHPVQGKSYGAWFRRLSATELEVFGAGFIHRASYGGFDALSVARSVLESVVLSRKHNDTTVDASSCPEVRDTAPGAF